MAASRSEAKHLKALEDENAKLKRLLADAMLDERARRNVRSQLTVSVSRTASFLGLPGLSWRSTSFPIITSFISIWQTLRHAFALNPLS